jgi:hypothetical protein
MNGKPVGFQVDLDIERFSGDLGTGGDSMQVSLDARLAKNFQITGLPCRGGPGTMYRVEASAPHFRTYSFFQSIQEDLANPAADDIEFWIKPGDVKDIRAVPFPGLPDKVQNILADAQMCAQKSEDDDLIGKSGASLYDNLGPLRKACLLNIAAKSADVSSDGCLSSVEALLICRQDRFFAFVDQALPGRLQKSLRYKSAESTLHNPIAGFEMTGLSFKTRDAHANLQVTFMRHKETGRVAADIDIDESSGIRHGFEVIRNAVSRNRTNPYLIREFLLSADPRNRSLDPGYGFAF